MTQLQRHNSFIVTSDYEGINYCYMVASQYRDLLNLNIDKFFAFQTLFLESVHNAIAHGNKYNSELVVFIDIYVTDHSLKLTIEDQGDGFDQREVKDPLDGENIHKESGRGLFFIKELSDCFEICGKGNIISITLNL